MLTALILVSIIAVINTAGLLILTSRDKAANPKYPIAVYWIWVAACSLLCAPLMTVLVLTSLPAEAHNARRNRAKVKKANEELNDLTQQLTKATEQLINELTKAGGNDKQEHKPN